MFLTILAFLIVIGVLVMVHELGHFIAAKKIGVKVEEFAIGFPPRIYSKKKNGTKYSVNAIPFGGYVKMLGELEHSTAKDAFENQTPGKRFIISIAGVMMNVSLAWILLTIGFAVGMAPLVSNPKVLPVEKSKTEIIVADIQKNSPAEQLSLNVNDLLIGAKTATEAVSFDSAESVGSFTRKHLGEKITVSYKNDDKIIEKEVILSSDSSAPLGVAVFEKTIIKVAWYKAPYVALYETWQLIKTTFVFLGDFFKNLFVRGQVGEGVGGPVAIYSYSGLALRAGIMIFIQFIAMLSVNLAILNILPFPALDGGRLLFILLEKIRGGKVVRENVENIIHTVGFILLIVLMIALTYRDILRLF